MSGVRDPAFWKRFSVAVHLDEEHGTTKPDLKHSDSWLARQERKRSRRAKICWAFWLTLISLTALVIIVCAWLLQSGILNHVGASSSASTSSSPSTTSTSATSTATSSPMATMGSSTTPH